VFHKWAFLAGWNNGALDAARRKWSADTDVAKIPLPRAPVIPCNGMPDGFDNGSAPLSGNGTSPIL